VDRVRDSYSFEHEHEKRARFPRKCAKRAKLQLVKINLKRIAVGLVFAVSLSWAGCSSVQDEKPKVSSVSPAILYESGLSHLESGDYLRARLSLEQAVSLDPNRAVYRNALGLTYLQLGALPQSVSAFREAIRLNANFSDAYNNLGVALAQSGKWEEAIAAFEKVLAFVAYISPEVVYQNLGWAYYNLGRFPEAESALKSALRLDPQMAMAHYTLGMLYEKQRRDADAANAYREAIKLAGDTGVGKNAQERLRALGN
jgi:Tfp pilus assembly protein PilF